jgi:hypothetical protein
MSGKVQNKENKNNFVVISHAASVFCSNEIIKLKVPCECVFGVC